MILKDQEPERRAMKITSDRKKKQLEELKKTISKKKQEDMRKLNTQMN